MAPGLAAGAPASASAEFVRHQQVTSILQQPVQIIAYAGLDASVFESGEFKGTRQHISKRGSPYLRRALYLAAFKAIQVDAELAAYFHRKRAQGKPYRVAMVAVSRKLLA